MRKKSETSKLVILYRFYNQAEAAAVQGRLESEGIKYWMLDELTVQMSSHDSPAIGGIRLQVMESDAQKAIAILHELGYGDDDSDHSSKMLAKLYRVTSKIPLLQHVRFELRLMIIVTVIACATSAAIYFATLPSTLERLTRQRWCVKQIIYNGKAYHPNTVNALEVLIIGSCPENISMDTDGAIRLPGFDSPTVRGWWTLRGKLLEVSEADAFGFVYDGIYEIEFVNNELILKSKQTTIHCLQRESPRIQIF